METSGNSDLMWIAFIAGFGGLLVFVGLLLEKVSDKTWFSNALDLRKSECRGTVGWSILMLGILVEIGAAVTFAVRDELQRRRDAPLNQPVSDVSYVLIFHVKAQNLSDVIHPLPNNLPAGYLGLQWSGTNTLEGINEFGSLQAEKMAGGPGFGGDQPRFWYFRMNFELRPLLMAKPHPPYQSALKVSDIKHKIESLDIYATRLTNTAEVLGGHVELLVNGWFRKTFEIFPQKPFTGPETKGAFNNSLELIATNAFPQVLGINKFQPEKSQRDSIP